MKQLLWKTIINCIREVLLHSFVYILIFKILADKSKSKISKKQTPIKEHEIIHGSKAGDVYSLAIIASEVINMKAAWEEPNENDTPRFRNTEEIIYLVKKGGILPPRPTLKPIVNDINPALVS